MRSVVDGVATSYEVHGEGPPVVLLHGFPDSGRLWDGQVGPLVDAGFSVVVPTLRGYGDSDKPTEVEAYGLVTIARDVLGVLDQVGHDRAHVVGHDWGGALAWILASLFPERVDHLAVLSTGHPTSFATAGFRQREQSWYMLAFQFVGVAEHWLADDDWANFRRWGRHPDTDAVIAALERDGSLTPALNWYRANVSPESLLGPPVQLPPVSAPTMGVWSSGDFALTEEQMTGSAAYVRGPWRYERLEGPSHWMQLDAPDAVSARLVDFLPR